MYLRFRYFIVARILVVEIELQCRLYLQLEMRLKPTCVPLWKIWCSKGKLNVEVTIVGRKRLTLQSIINSWFLPWPPRLASWFGDHSGSLAQEENIAMSFLNEFATADWKKPHSIEGLHVFSCLCLHLVLPKHEACERLSASEGQGTSKHKGCWATQVADSTQAHTKSTCLLCSNRNSKPGIHLQGQFAGQKQ